MRLAARLQPSKHKQTGNQQACAAHRSRAPDICGAEAVECVAGRVHWQPTCDRTCALAACSCCNMLLVNMVSTGTRTPDLEAIPARHCRKQRLCCAASCSCVPLLREGPGTPSGTIFDSLSRKVHLCTGNANASRRRLMTRALMLVVASSVGLATYMAPKTGVRAGSPCCTFSPRSQPRAVSRAQASGRAFKAGVALP